MDQCDSCHYVYAEVSAHDVPTRLAAFGPRYRDLLCPTTPPAAWETLLRTRPAPEVWSALEYACHIRDVFLVQRDRLYVALVEDTPRFSPMYRDERVTLARYNAQDPATVVNQISTAAQLIAQAFAALDAAQLARPCIYNYPAPAAHSLLWVGQHVIHEGEHHCRDIAAVLARVSTGQ
ncbi:MAG: DinB family protein [Candidatus Tectimicrobiota bacterium]